MIKKTIAIPMLSVEHHGGVRIILQLANHLVGNGHEVTILVPKDKYRPLYPVDKKIKLIFLSSVGKNKIAYLRTLIEFVQKMPKNDIIMANFFPTFYPAIISSLFGKGRLVYFPQGVEATHVAMKFPVSFLIKMAERITFLSNKTVIVSADSLKNKILEINPKANTFKIDLGLPEGVFYPDGTVGHGGRSGIIYYARNEVVKGIDDFVDALRYVVEKNIVFELKIISRDGKCHEKFKWLRNNGVKIEFFRPKNDSELRKIYSRSLFIVNSSFIEGFCLPVLEAMACGTPAVVTASGGPEEYAIDGYNCLVVPAHEPKLLAIAIEKMIKDQKLRNRLEVNCLKTAQNFKFSKFTAEFENCLMGKLN